MRVMFETPWFGNLLGWVYKLLWRATKHEELPLTYCTQPPWFQQHPQHVTVYVVERFPFMKSIMGQAVGNYIFIRKDLLGMPGQRAQIIAHELVHVQQQYRLRWFGVKFFVVYVWQFVTYAVAYMGLISLVLRHMPLEKEAYNATKPDITPT